MIMMLFIVMIITVCFWSVEVFAWGVYWKCVVDHDSVYLRLGVMTYGVCVMPWCHGVVFYV